LRTKGWFAVVTAGFDTATAVAGLTAFSLLGVGGLLALPILALPAMLAGAPVSPGLAHTALLGIAGFALFAVFGAMLLYTDRPLATIGRAVQGLRNWVTRGRRLPITDLGKRLLTERNTIRTVLGEKWWQAVLLTPGGLGIVEASLSGLLVLAGVHPGDAFLSTLAYRIASYWLPLLAGPPAYLLFRYRYGRPAPRAATPAAGGNADDDAAKRRLAPG
jgi:hypothetical protein